MKITRIALALALVCGSFSTSFAQETMTQPRPEPTKAPEPAPMTVDQRQFSVGLMGAYGMMINGTPGFTLPTVPTCCASYTSTGGGGVLVGGVFELPLSSSLELSTRVLFQSASATFTTDEPTTIRVGNTVESTTLRHTLESSQGFVFVEPVAAYRVGGRLDILAGLRVGTVLSATYSQDERIADPTQPVRFEDGSTIRNATSGDLPNKSALQAGAVIGLRYSLPMNAAGTMQLVPEISYSPMFTNLVSDASWTVSPLRIGASILFSIVKKVEEKSPLRPGKQ